MKFTLLLTYLDPTQFCGLARAAEQAGFDSVAVPDHVVHPEKIASPYPYTDDGSPRWPPFTPWPDPWLAISAMAAVTERLRFITSVFVLPLRNPFLVAKTVATAAVMSKDRITLGIGAGWMQEEFQLMEQSFPGRGRRMEEMLEVMRRLWAGGMAEYRGEFYAFDRLEMSPVPKQPIPLYFGGLSEPALRRAARLGDGWVSELHDREELRRIMRKLHAYRADSERAGQPLDVLASVSDAVGIDAYRRLEGIGVTHLMNPPWVLARGRTNSLEHAIQRFGDDVIAKMRV
jgi:probable F420-dependent oxidoreductase